MTAVDIAYPIVWVAFFIISATFHEAAHAWVAKRGGDLTAYEGGQVSLNPVPHIRREPWGMIVFPVISSVIFGWPFGYAKTPYNALWADRHPRKAAMMSAAGPLANLLIVVLCVVVIKAGMLTGFFLEPDSVGFKHIVDISSGPPGLPTVISMLFTLNLVLFVLNLLPLPPLDGSGITAIFLKDETARKYQSVISNPAFGFLGFLLAWQVFNPLFHPIFLGVINLIFWPTRYG
jgi:Zn-dependent protease